MNTPNKLTVLRVIMVPFFMAAMLVKSLPYHYLIAFAIFGIASLTDLIDGKMARKNAQVTDFGKFLDPLADKILTTSALVCLMQLGLCNIWVVMIVLAREFMVTSIRLVAASEGNVIAANMWGKVKTVIQMTSMTLIIFLLGVQQLGILEGFPMVIFSNVLMWITAAATFISGGKYLVDNIKLINTAK